MKLPEVPAVETAGYFQMRLRRMASCLSTSLIKSEIFSPIDDSGDSNLSVQVLITDQLNSKFLDLFTYSRTDQRVEFMLETVEGRMCV
jgi:hypothetical protein